MTGFWALQIIITITIAYLKASLDASPPAFFSARIAISSGAALRSPSAKEGRYLFIVPRVPDRNPTVDLREMTDVERHRPHRICSGTWTAFDVLAAHIYLLLQSAPPPKKWFFFQYFIRQQQLKFGLNELERSSLSANLSTTSNLTVILICNLYK